MASPDEASPRLDRRTVIKSAAAMAIALNIGTTYAKEAEIGNYVTFNGLELYYENHGADHGLPPVVLLHGALMDIETAFSADLLPRLAAFRRVIAIEAQGHGHTADRPTPLSEDQLAADTAGVLDHLGIARADFVAHSLGGIAAVGTALRRPDLVRSLTVIGRHFSPDGMLPELTAMQSGAQPSRELAAILPTPAEFAAWAESYGRVAPNPAAFQDLAMKVQTFQATWPGWSEEQLRSIDAPTLIAIGDHDFVLPAHAAQVARTMPDAQLAVLPGSTHMSLLKRGSWLEPMMRARWDAIAS